MSQTAGCFGFLRGRRSNKEVAAPLEVQQPPRRHGGGEVVSNPGYILRFISNPPFSQWILAF